MPELPKTLFSPSVGFAWDVAGTGRTVIRGGFYKAYEKRFPASEESNLMPPGLGGKRGGGASHLRSKFLRRLTSDRGLTSSVQYSSARPVSTLKEPCQ
jgi:hypothetical protein